MNHHFYMQKALEEAMKGWPAVVPNPMVGCVIVYKEKVIATGYHHKSGEAHAEVNAIKNMPKDIQPSECRLYVTLEPCRHHGKTPPCADLIIEKGFKEVIVACTDPNPLVSGSGVRSLLEAGIDVTTGVMEKEARQLNRRFITFYEKKRPYITLKWALSADGFVSRDPVPEKREQNLITRRESQEMVHRLRSENMAILVGKNTVLRDNPELTTRLVNGPNAIRAFIDKNLEVPQSFKVYDGKARTFVFNSIKDEKGEQLCFVKVDFGAGFLEQVMHKLYQLNVQSVLVEGGTRLLNDLIEAHLWDEAMIFQNPDLNFGTGVKGPVFPLKNTFRLVGEDKLFTELNNHVVNI